MTSVETGANDHCDGSSNCETGIGRPSEAGFCLGLASLESKFCHCILHLGQHAKHFHRELVLDVQGSDMHRTCL